MKYSTGKRAQIIEFLSTNAERSFTIEEIADAITENGHGRSTVYRIVAELLEGRCIRRLSDGATRHCTYQYVGDEECKMHLHLKCRDCGRLIHLDDEISHELCDTLLSRGFSLEEGSMLFGKCEECK
jgi:Fur family ferric uptake transcriptional regulator